MCNIHNTRLNESRRVEDLSGHITAGSNDNESAATLGQSITNLNLVCILVENRYTAQFAARPFCLVLSKLGIHRFEERTDKGDLECWTNDRALLPKIANY